MHGGLPGVVGWAADGCGDGELRLFRAATVVGVREEVEPLGHLTYRDDPCLLWTGGGYLEIRNLLTGKLAKEIRVGPVRLLTVLGADSHAIAVSVEGIPNNVAVWDLITGDKIAEMPMGMPVVTGRAWLVETEIIISVASDDGRVFTYVLNRSRQELSLLDMTSDTAPVLQNPPDLSKCKAVIPRPAAPEQLLLLEHGGVRIWDMGKSRFVGEIALPPDATVERETTCCAATVLEGREVAVLGDDGCRLHLIDIGTQRTVGAPWRLPRRPSSVDVSTGGVTAVMGNAMATFTWSASMHAVLTTRQ